MESKSGSCFCNFFCVLLDEYETFYSLAYCRWNTCLFRGITTREKGKITMRPEAMKNSALSEDLAIPEILRALQVAETRTLCICVKKEKCNNNIDKKEFPHLWK